MKKPSSRLSQEDWIKAGFKALVANGPSALKAEPLARRLKTTKGSFYWHFKDVPDFRAMLLSQWQAAASAAITVERGSTESPTQKLYDLENLVTKADATLGARGIEPAVRAWAQGDRDAIRAVQDVDSRRLEYLTDVLAGIGLTNPDFARVVYATQIGLGALSAGKNRDTPDAMSTLMAALLALQEA